MNILQKINELKEKGYFSKIAAWGLITSLCALLVFFWYLNGWQMSGSYYYCPTNAVESMCKLEFYDQGCTQDNPLCKPRVVYLQHGESYGKKPNPITEYQFTGSFILFIVWSIINHVIYVARTKWFLSK